MKSSLKNIIVIAIIITMAVCVYFTINSSKSNNLGTPSEMPNRQVSENEPPSIPGNNGDKFFDDMKEARMSDESLDESSNTPPSMPNGGTPPEIHVNTGSKSTITYVLLGIESLIASCALVYLLMSNFNKKTFKETYQDKDKLIISGLCVVILTASLTYLCTTFTVDSNSNTPSGIPNGGGNSGSVTYSAVKEITSSEDITSGEYQSTTTDENTISVNGKITSTLSGITVNKTGDSDGGDNTSFYGTNSAIIAKDGATLTIKNAIITTEATGANGVFSYGGSATTSNSSLDNTTIDISDSTITTSKDNSGGIMTTGGGIMNATNLTINTAGTSSAAIRSDRGGGTVVVDGGTYKTTGKGSPAIYSTADITVKNATLIATASEGVIIEGKNSITLENVDLTDTNNTLNGQSTTYKNVFLYQSMSGDAADGEAIFIAKNSEITTNKGDSFYVTNTTATINLENNKIVNNDSTGSFLRIQKDSWGNSGSNGGTVTLNLANQEANGNIVVDSISTLTINMTSSTYEGIINTNNTAKSIIIKLDSESKIKLMGDSYITELEDADTAYNNIDLNGYKLYVNGVELSK